MPLKAEGYTYYRDTNFTSVIEMVDILSFLH